MLKCRPCTLWDKARKAMATILGGSWQTSDPLNSNVTVVPYIQQIYDCQTGNPIGAEIKMHLSDVNDGDRGLFQRKTITEMELNCEITPLTCNMMKDVAVALYPFLNKFPVKFFISFNIYAPQLYDERLVSAVCELRRAFPSSIDIILEVDECSLPEYDDSLVDVMDLLRGQGIQLILDNFGLTSSSLMYLEYGGFSFLKMNSSITDTCNHKLVYKRLISSLVLISQELELCLVAEGITGAEQRDLLFSCGVTSMQGVFFEDALSIENFTSKLS